MKKTRKYFSIIIIMCVVMLTESITVFADPSIDDTINEKKEERDKNQRELDEVNASIEELANEAETVEEEIEEVSGALVQVIAEIEVIEQDIEDKNAEIAQSEIDYANAVEEERKQYEAMKIRIQYLYENGNTSLLSMYMETGNYMEAMTKAEYVEDLYEYDRKMLIAYQETVQEVDNIHERLLAEKEELEALQEDRVEEQSYMEEVMAELEELADDYEEQMAEAERIASDYAKKIKEQNKQINALEAEKKRQEEEARRKAEEEARRKAEEARRSAQNEVAESQNTGVVVTTNSSAYDVSSIYSTSGSDLGKSIAAYGCQFIGNPYVPGGTSLTNGADCSGFVYSVYKAFGYTVPRTSSSLRGAGTEVSYENAQPGDVICYPGHVAIYIGNGMIVHASTQKTGIKVSRAEYRSFITIRRII